jgi:transposase InsO family protein
MVTKNLGVSLHVVSIKKLVKCVKHTVNPWELRRLFDNAMREFFYASMECELLWLYHLRSRQEAKLAVFDYIDGWYNTRRRHSALDSMSPIAYG